MSPFKIIFYLLNCLRFLPHVIIFYTHKSKLLLKADRDSWISTIKHENDFTFKNLLWLLFYLPEYRSVFYMRIGKISKVLAVLARERESLFFDTKSDKIGEGIVIQHGFSTIINAKSLGSNCQIWHNVTIGLSESGTSKKPVIGSNVKISAGAIIIGEISIGNNVTVGAGSVVTKSIPDDCIVVGNPALIVKRNGKRVNEKL